MELKSLPNHRFKPARHHLGGLSGQPQPGGPIWYVGRPGAVGLHTEGLLCSQRLLEELRGSLKVVGDSLIDSGN